MPLSGQHPYGNISTPPQQNWGTAQYGMGHAHGLSNRTASTPPSERSWYGTGAGCTPATPPPASKLGGYGTPGSNQSRTHRFGSPATRSPRTPDDRPVQSHQVWQLRRDATANGTGPAGNNNSNSVSGANTPSAPATPNGPNAAGSLHGSSVTPTSNSPASARQAAAYKNLTALPFRNHQPQDGGAGTPTGGLRRGTPPKTRTPSPAHYAAAAGYGVPSAAAAAAGGGNPANGHAASYRAALAQSGAGGGGGAAPPAGNGYFSSSQNAYVPLAQGGGGGGGAAGAGGGGGGGGKTPVYHPPNPSAARRPRSPSPARDPRTPTSMAPPKRVFSTPPYSNRNNFEQHWDQQEQQHYKHIHPLAPAPQAPAEPDYATSPHAGRRPSMLWDGMSQFIIAPQAAEDKGKYCVVLDLDETLVYARDGPIQCRPGYKELMRVLASSAETVVWTAGERSYAKEVLRQLDSGVGAIRHCIYRHHLWFDGQVGQVKDLRLLGRDPDKVLLVENTPDCLRKNATQAVLVPDFRGSDEQGILTLLTVFMKDLFKSNAPVAHFLRSSPLITPREVVTNLGDSIICHTIGDPDYEFKRAENPDTLPQYQRRPKW
ncbi:hypothetical protein DIPPA_28159 [Diplonema papillatum]|nr:hypothetical protein DIPPA_28159 [Diplonema papillatum]KAJ9473388.1 hypothetical protein DIPPA_28159 [Diplonema papillatum]